MMLEQLRETLFCTPSENTRVVSIYFNLEYHDIHALLLTKKQIQFIYLKPYNIASCIVRINRKKCAVPQFMDRTNRCASFYDLIRPRRAIRL